MKVVEENFRQLLRKVLCLCRTQIFVYIDEDFAINGIRPKFLSLLLTGITHIGITERGSFKKNIRKRCISCSSKAVHNIKLLLTYSEFTMYLQDQLKAGSFVGTTTGLSHDMQFFSYSRAMK